VGEVGIAQRADVVLVADDVALSAAFDDSIVWDLETLPERYQQRLQAQTERVLTSEEHLRGLAACQGGTRKDGASYTSPWIGVPTP
jgi:hypothetical protein